jgi:MATE family multidrug resistance protein
VPGFFVAAAAAASREANVLEERNILGPGRSSLTRELLWLALPLVAATASRMLMGFIDFVMVAKLGTDAQAAMSPATLLVWAFIALGMGMATSVQTFTSQAQGRGEPERGPAYAWQCVYLGLALSLVAWPATRWIPALYDWIGTVARHAPGVRTLEIEYTQIAVWSMIPSVMAAGLEGFFNGIQRPRVTLMAVLVSLTTLVIGNYLLIWGHCGFPRMGIAGSALATVIAWWTRVAVLFTVFCSAEFNRTYHTRRSFAPSWRRCLDIFRIGGPTSVAWLIDISSWVVFLNLIVPPFGTAAMAATAIALQYTHAAFMPAIGVGMALCSQVGFALGAGRPDEAAARTRTALRLTMAYMGGIGLLLFLLRGPLMSAIAVDAAVIAAGMWIMCWVALYQVFDAMSITFIYALRGAGDTRTPAVLNAVCCWLVFIGGGYLVARVCPTWGVNGPWLMAVTYLTVLGLLLWWRYRAGAWRKIRLFEDRGATPAPAAVTPLGSAGGEA